MKSRHAIPSLDLCAIQRRQRPHPWEGQRNAPSLHRVAERGAKWSLGAPPSPFRRSLGFSLARLMTLRSEGLTCSFSRVSVKDLTVAASAEVVADLRTRRPEFRATDLLARTKRPPIDSGMLLNALACFSPSSGVGASGPRPGDQLISLLSEVVLLMLRGSVPDEVRLCLRGASMGRRKLASSLRPLPSARHFVASLPRSLSSLCAIHSGRSEFEHAVAARPLPKRHFNGCRRTPATQTGPPVLLSLAPLLRPLGSSDSLPFPCTMGRLVLLRTVITGFGPRASAAYGVQPGERPFTPSVSKGPASRAPQMLMVSVFTLAFLLFGLSRAGLSQYNPFLATLATG